MKKVFIVGGDGFARECYLNLVSLPEYGKEIEFGGFLGHGGYGHTVDYKSYQYLYKGEFSEHKFSKNDYCIIGAGFPKLREKIYNDLKAKGCQFYTMIVTNELSDTVQIGEANIFLGVVNTANIKIGKGNVFNGDIIVAHDCEIGDFNFVGPRSTILGNVKIGNRNELAVGTTILPKAKIGNNNKIAPMSVVYKGCKDNCYLAGNPALKIGEVS